jgi:hypothetical protein
MTGSNNSAYKWERILLFVALQKLRCGRSTHEALERLPDEKTAFPESGYTAVTWTTQIPKKQKAQPCGLG